MAARFDYLSFPTLLGIYDIVCEKAQGEFGDKSALEAVVESAKRTVEQESEPLAVAATYIVEILTRSPFKGFNEAVAWVAASTLLRIHGIKVKATVTDAIDIFEGVQSGSCGYEEVYAFLEERT
jgi:prophage maintenance system killer protein